MFCFFSHPVLFLFALEISVPVLWETFTHIPTLGFLWDLPVVVVVVNFVVKWGSRIRLTQSDIHIHAPLAVKGQQVPLLLLRWYQGRVRTFPIIQESRACLTTVQCPWKESYDKPSQLIKSKDITCRQRSMLSKRWYFQVSCMDVRAEHRRIDTLELWCWRIFLRILWTARSSNESILKEINLEYSLEGLMPKLQSFGCVM